MVLALFVLCLWPKLVDIFAYLLVTSVVTKKVRVMNSAITDIERFHKIAFEETDMAIFISNPNGRCLTVNPRALSLTGYFKQELIGQDVFDLFQTGDPGPTIDRERLPTGETVVTQCRLRCKDGSARCVELRIRKLSDGSFLKIAHDIAEREKKDEILRKNEELFRIAFDHAPTGMSIIAPDGVTYLAVNPLLCEMFGYTREEFFGKTIHLVTHPDDEALSNEWIRKKFNGEPCEPVLEKRYIHRDGHVIWGLVQAHWIKNDDGSHRMAIAHIQDITERKKAEEERKNLQEQLTAAMEMAHLGYWQYDVGNDTFIFNDHFYKIFRTSAEKVGGYTLSPQEYAVRFIHPDDRHLLDQEIRKSLDTDGTEVSRKLEHRIRYEDGTTGYISVYYFIVRDQQGRIIKTYGINQDITDRKQAEEERIKLEDQVRQAQKMESIGLLAGGIAHDFNNLLTPIIGYTDILIHNNGDEDQRVRQLRRIRGASERAKDVAQRLLAFSKKQLLELKTIDLGDIIRTFENMLRRTIRENIEINVKTSPDICLIKADQGQIEQVLLNLSINAQDAIPESGKIEIKVETIDLDASYAVKNQDLQPGPYVMLTVTDNGVGMDEDGIEHIFEPFYTTKELGRGTGLGLSTAYGIIKQHGGSISVFSQKGRGSAFEIMLPRVTLTKEESVEENTCQVDDIIGGHETILVAEDSEIVRLLACDMLEVLGYKVLVAKDPGQCIDLVKHHQGVIHLLLTDIIMPKMNGKELYDVLNDLKPGLKVIFMSGYTSNIIRQDNIINKKTNFIQKPFSIYKLASIIRQTLDSTQSH
jgi:PAS domain S-box-containing protein